MEKNEQQQVNQQPKGFIASLESLSDNLLQYVANEEQKTPQEDQLH